MNHDAAHCADYSKSCPAKCYRAALTKELKSRERLDLVGIPMSYIHFEGTPQCEKTNKDITDD